MNPTLPPLAGRARELADVEAVIDSAQQGQSRIVLVSGEPGIGKSRLLLHAASHAQERGLLVLRGNCYEDAEMAPYQPLVEVLRDLVRQRPNAVDRIDDRSFRAALAALLPELTMGEHADDLSSFSEAERRQRLFDAFGRLLVTISASQPLVLIVDDLHWADEPSALLLRHLTRSLRQSGSAMLCAYRDSDLELGDPFERVLIDLTREHFARRLVLRRLDVDATTEIVARVIDSSKELISTAAIDSIQRESEGVPFFIEELTLHLREEGLLRQMPSGRWELTQGAEPLVPQSIRGVISRRLSRLNPAARELLTVASISGREFGMKIVRDVALKRGIADEGAVVDALEECVARRLLVRREDACVFAHEQIREVLYHGTSAIRRRQLHQMTAEAIERHHPDDAHYASRLAYHYSHGDDLERALRFTILAAEEATRIHALGDARRHYDSALDILDLIGDPKNSQIRFDVLLARDGVIAASGEHMDRLNGINALLATGECLNASARVKALTRASDHALQSGNDVVAVDRARAALALADRDSATEQFAALLALGQALSGRAMGEPSLLYRDRERLGEAIDIYRTAHDIAIDLGLSRERARISQELGVLEWSVLDDSDGDDAERARGWLLRALELFRTIGDRKGEVTSLIALAYRRSVPPSAQATDPRESYVSFLEEIRRLRATEHRLTRLSERSRMEALALLSISLYCRTNGWYEVALRRAEQALVWAAEARDTRVAVMARIGLSETERILGRTPRAIEHAEHALALIDGLARSQPTVEHQRDAAVAALAAGYSHAGNVDRALQLSEDAVEKAKSIGPPARIADALTALAEIAEIVGVPDLAIGSARDALRVAAGMTGNITWDIRAELVLARRALATGDAGLALGHASAAAGRLNQRGVPLVWLRIAVDMTRGQALREVGYADDAREALASAHSLVTTIANRITDPGLRSTYLTRSPQARDVLAAAAEIGLPSIASVDGAGLVAAPDLLTRREIEVLRMVAAGSPNREIADQLFISEKTVARHLTNIFTKLNVESRTQAAAWAYRQGIA